MVEKLDIWGPEIEVHLMSFKQNIRNKCLPCSIEKLHSNNDSETFSSPTRYLAHLSCVHNFYLTEEFRLRLIKTHGNHFFTRKQGQEFIERKVESDWHYLKLDPETEKKLKEIKAVKAAVKNNNLPGSQITEVLTHTFCHLITDVKKSLVENQENFLLGLQFYNFL